MSKRKPTTMEFLESNKQQKVNEDAELLTQAFAPSPVPSAKVTPTKAMMVAEQGAKEASMEKAQEKEDTSKDDKIEFKGELPKLLLESLQSEDPAVVLAALTTTADKIKDMTAEAMAEFLALGGHSFVVLTMNKWKGNAAMQGKCCCIIGRVVGVLDGNKFHGINKIVEALQHMSVVKMVVRALEIFPDHLEVQICGIASLGNLLYGNNPATAKMLVEDLMVVPTVVKAMERFEEEKVQSLSSWLLRRLCDLGMATSLAMTEYGVVAVSMAVKLFPTNQNINKNAFWFQKAVLSARTDISK